MANHVLIVEDDEMVQAFVALHLENEGYVVSKASTGGEGLDILAGEEIDLVLLDLNLPDGDGLSIAQKIREKSSIPIIILTARKGKDDKMMGLGLGADEYLTKPIEPEELFLRVRNLLARAGLATGTSPPKAETPTFPDNTRRRSVTDTNIGGATTGDGNIAAKKKRRHFGLMLTLMVLTLVAGGFAWWLLDQENQIADVPRASGDLHSNTADQVPQRLPEVEPDHPLAATSYSWVLKSKCDKLPYVSWWKVKTHADIVGYVNRRHKGNWKPYINDWTTRLVELQNSYSLGKGVRTPEGEVLARKSLSGQIDKTKQRLDVILCLSREAAEYSHRKIVPTR